LGGTDGNVNFTSLASGNTMIYDAVSGVWENAFLTDGTGISITEGAGSITITNSAPDQTVALTQAGTTTITGTYPNFTISSADQFQGTVTSVTGTSPVASSGGTTPAISLSAGYGDTLNPYASKTANFVLAAPNGSAGVPTFRAIVANDIPTLNQNTTGTASNVTGTVAVANGGTGQTTYTNGQLLIGNTTGNTLTKATLSAGTGISITNGTGSISIASTATGTVTSVAATVPAFLSVTGSPITTSGTLAISLSGTALPVVNGGTGVTTSTGSGAVVLGTSPTLTTPTINSAQVSTVSGTAPLYMARAWVNFNGTGTISIRGNGNVSSITDNGTGDYTINFSTAMSDANYSVSGSTTISASNNATCSLMIMSGNPSGTPSIEANTASAVRIRTAQQGVSNAVDTQYICVSVFR